MSIFWQENTLEFPISFAMMKKKGGDIMTIPRPEHPRPQFMRSRWENLNGTWQFEIDNTCSGEDRGLQKPGVCLSSTITVPFCPESKLSGVGNTDFMNGVWYKRTVSYTPGEERVFLHFGAVDYKTTVYVNGQQCGTHFGGYVSFFFDIILEYLCDILFVLHHKNVVF